MRAEAGAAGVLVAVPVRGLAARLRRCTVKLLMKAWMAFRSRRGQSLVEYALILALVAIVVIVALTALGGHTRDAMSNVSNTIGNVA
jgi:pilus assembly protein Flp/PilA